MSFWLSISRHINGSAAVQWRTREPVRAAHLSLLMCNLACRRVVSVDTAANKAIHERIVIPQSSWSAIK